MNKQIIQYLSVLTIFIITLITCLSCSQIKAIETGHLPTSILYQNSIILPFIPDKICYSNFSQTFLLLKTSKNLVVCIDQNGKVLQKIGEFGFEKGQFISITDIATDSFGNLFVVDKMANKVVKFDEMGQFVNSVTYASLQIKEPKLIAVKDNGDLLLYDIADNLIYCFNNRRKLRYSLGRFTLISPKALEISNDVNFILDSGNNSILIFDNFGGIVSTIENKEKIIDMAGTKNLLYYIDLSANLFCYKVVSNTHYQLASSTELFPVIHPQLLVTFDKKIGIVNKKRLYIFQLKI